MSAVTLKSARLTLRPVTPMDAEAFFDHARLPAVAENAGFLPDSIAETRRYLRRSASEWKKSKPERMTFSVLLKRDRAWIGSLELRWLYDGIAEMGFFIHPRHWGNGYAPEAATAALRAAFGRFGAHRVQGSCWTKNKRSIRVLKKLRFRREGRLRGYAKVGGKLQDDYLYAMTIRDWRSR